MCMCICARALRGQVTFPRQAFVARHVTVSGVTHSFSFKSFTVQVSVPFKVLRVYSLVLNVFTVWSVSIEDSLSFFQDVVFNALTVSCPFV